MELESKDRELDPFALKARTRRAIKYGGSEK